jgi:bacterial/archaeal transporter family protein
MRSLFAQWQFWALLSAGCAALTTVFGKLGVEYINSDFATLLRTAFILILLSVIVLATGAQQPLNGIPQRTYFFLALSGLATGGSWLCYYRALKLGPASLVAPIDKLSVVLVAIFATVFLGERLLLKNWLGIGLIAVGAILVTRR